MANMKIKKGDTVVVLSGKDKGKQGKVQVVIPSDRKVVVEGVNIVTCHTKPRRQGETGGIVKKRSRDLCEQGAGCLPQCSKATRVAYKIEDGKKSRVCKHCGAAL